MTIIGLPGNLEETTLFKKAMFVVLEMILFFVVYAVGSILPGANKLPEWSTHLASGKLFVWDGVVMMLGLFVLIVLVQAVRKRLATGWQTPVLALVLTLLFLAATSFPLAKITPSPGMVM